MKSYLIVFLAVFIGFNHSCFAQGVKCSLLSSNASELVVKVDFPDFQTRSVDVEGTPMQLLQMKNAYPMQEAGCPELLKSSFSFIVPENSHPTTEIINADYSLFSHFLLAPSKGKVYRNVDPSTMNYVLGDSYRKDKFLYEDTVVLGLPYRLRDYYGVSAQFFPFAYNPVQQTLKVYKSITVRIRFNSSHTIKRARKVVRTFHEVYDQHFINYSQTKTNPIVEEGDILVITPAVFFEEMQPYVEWKHKNGYQVEMVSLDEVGTTSNQVKSFIADHYTQNPQLAFVVIVGDYQKFPYPTVGGNTSDNYYVEVAGDDYYPDLILGKISAENNQHVATQVQRFIEYEQASLDTNYLSVYCGIASSEGGYYSDNGEIDYEHIRNIGEMLTQYTYTSGYEFFQGSQGGMDASGSPSAAQIASAINAGVGIINYCGHGDVTLWGTSRFSNSDVVNLNNMGKLPFIISTACLNGDYKGKTCFAESWLRSTRNDQPIGAVSVLMSSIEQPWNAPMCGQDGMNEFLTGANNVVQKYTFGGIVFNGILKMLDNYADYETARTWILFGDPALMLRTTAPKALEIEHDTLLLVGTTEVTITSPVENAKVILFHDGVELDMGRITDSTLTLTLPDTLTVEDTIEVFATAYNYGSAISKIAFYELPPEPEPEDTLPMFSEITLLQNPVWEGTKLFVNQELLDHSFLYYSLYDAYGRLIESAPLVSSYTSIDMSAYASGMYVLRIYNEGKKEVKTLKIIKKNC